MENEEISKPSQSTVVPARQAGTKGPIPFANDPFRGPPLSVTEELITPLSGPNHLSTALVDYLVQRAMPRHLPDGVLIGSSNAMSYFEAMNQKIKKHGNRQDAKTVAALKNRYQIYSFNRFQFMAANCSERHFVVIKVDFDVRREMIFQDVRVYDSLRRTGRHNEAVNKNSIGANFLRHLQVFLSQFAFYGAPGNDKLIKNPDLILADAAYTCCPVQHNMHDCALFAFATLLHLVWDEEVTGDTFSQAHITKFREDLHAVLSLAQTDEMCFPDPKQFLTSNFLRSFFPRLENKEYGGGAEGSLADDTTSTDYVQILSQCRDTSLSRSLTDGGTERDRRSAKRSRPPNDDDSDDDSDSDGDSSHGSIFLESNEGEDATNASPSDDNQDDNQDRTEDKIFQKFFDGSDISFDSLRDIDFAIDRYEQTSGYRILIRRSAAFARTYRCGSHYSCCFRAKFGKMRNESYIVLKTKNSVLFHCGPPLPPRAKGGRAYKKRIKGRLDSSLDNVCTVKADTPVPRDIMKAAANLDGFTTTYNQSFRAISGSKTINYKKDLREFQLISPYLQKFKALNPGSTTDFERDAENHICRLFICPGIMKTSLRFVRPVMSLDACHLKSQWKGTLYTASVKTGCNELYPVALAIMSDNENDEGWTWFLNHLHSTIELLVMDHPLRRVTYKYFTFISDRQKGLINALERVFPMNHSCFCHVHIRRNTDVNVGKRVGDCVYSLATTFSTRVAEELLAKIESISIKGKEYLEAIPPSQWRNTAWMNDPGLPPRFGIGSTNMSESTNSMLEHSRDVNWLQCIDTILSTMVQRISTLRSKYVGKTGIVDHVEGLLTKLWDDCAGYRVVEIEEGGYRYTVYRLSRGRNEPSVSYTINVLDQTCECGEWQNRCFPCVDAVAYFKLWNRVSLQYVLENKVHEYYSYANQARLLKQNVVPVCVETLSHDGTTLPPVVISRQRGRPKTKRFRPRSKFAQVPEQSSIKCSKCGQHGHNARTCEARQEMEASSRNSATRTTRNTRQTTSTDVS